MSTLPLTPPTFRSARRAALVAVCLAAAGCGSAPPLYQTAPPAETAIDGSARDWPAALRPVPGESGLTVGLRAEDDALAVVLVAGDDRQARRIALGGVRVWIDPSGGAERVLGLRYPATQDPSFRDVARSRARRGERGGTSDPTVLRRRFESGLDAVEVTRGRVMQRLSPTGDGFEAAAEWGPRALVVEMRVPFSAESPLLDLTDGAPTALGVGVELLDASPAALRATLAERRSRRTGREETADGTLAEAPTVEEAVTVTRWLRVEL